MDFSSFNRVKVDLIRFSIFLGKNTFESQYVNSEAKCAISGSCRGGKINQNKAFALLFSPVLFQKVSAILESET